MKKTKCSDEKITCILRQAEAGTSAIEVCRQNGISEQAFYRWKKRFAGMGVGEACHPGFGTNHKGLCLWAA